MSITLNPRLSDLAAKYARQLANVDDLRRTVELADRNFQRENRELNETSDTLKAMIGASTPLVLVPIGNRRHLLVHTVNGSFGTYASIDIVTECE